MLDQVENFAGKPQRQWVIEGSGIADQGIKSGFYQYLKSGLSVSKLTPQTARANCSWAGFGDRRIDNRLMGPGRAWRKAYKKWSLVPAILVTRRLPLRRTSKTPTVENNYRSILVGEHRARPDSLNRASRRQGL